MIKWVTKLPETEIDTNEYKPFIKNQWFREHYMWFAYALMFLLILPVSLLTTSMNDIPFLLRLGMIIPVFLIHELLHVLVVFRIGDIYLTHSGLFFWLRSDAHMSKIRFLIFMSLPFLVLSVLPLVIKLFYTGPLVPYISYIAWINSIMASSDILNSMLILIKPRNSVFWRGYYKC
jgi:hypothetical protein